MTTRREFLEVRAKVAEKDALLVEAVADVDTTLIDSWLRKTPWERAELSFDAAAGLEELRTWRRVG